MPRKQQQTEDFNEDSLRGLPDQDDEYTLTEENEEPDFLGEEEEEGSDLDEEVEHKPSFMDRLTGGMNLSGKKPLYLIGGIVVIAVILFIFTPLNSIFDKSEESTEEGSEESGGGFFSKITGMFSSSNEEDELDISVEVPTTVLDFVAVHEEKYPGYTYAYNEMDGSTTFTGLDGEGLYHDLIYDIDFNLVAEYVDGVEVFNDIVQETSEEAPPAEQSAEQATDGTEPDTVSIDRATYNNSTISLPAQKAVGEFDEYQNPIEKTSKQRLIVQFYKLPLTGKVPMVKAVVAETDEVIIFPVDLTQYVQLPEKGSTVIEMLVTEGHGAIGYSEIRLVNWQR